MKQSTLGSRVRTLRLQNKMTQAQLGDRLGVTDKAVSKWERDLSYPDIALFPKLAEVLGVTVNDLLRECGDGYRPTNLLHVFEMSRDVRIPLHIILGFVEIAKNNLDDPEVLQRYLEGIRVSGEYLITLLDNIVQSSRSGGNADARDDLPLGQKKVEEYIREQLSVHDEAAVETFDFSGKRILVVDDVEINREIAAEVLKQTGAETDFAENGLVCLEKMEKAPFGYYDLILMDLMMPGMGGLEATRRIRALPDRRKASIPIIAMTTNVYEEDRISAFDAGMNAFAEKPIFVEKLFLEMEKYLRE